MVMRSSLRLLLLALVLVQVQAGKTLDCRVFPFHPVCRGFNVGKRSGHLAATWPPIMSTSRPNDALLLCRKYTFAPKCRGTTAKRAPPMPDPTLPTMERAKRSNGNPDLPNTFASFYKRENNDQRVQRRGRAQALPDTFSSFYQENKKDNHNQHPFINSNNKRFLDRLFGRHVREQNDDGLLNTFSSFYLPDTMEEREGGRMFNRERRGDNDDDLATFSSFYVPEKRTHRIHLTL